MLLIILIFIVIYLFYKWSISTFDYFEKQGIPFSKPAPFFGSNLYVLFNRKPITEILDDLYYEFKDEKAFGLFQFRSPCLLLRDPALIKLLTVTDFEYFTDHRAVITEDIDPLLGNVLFVLQGAKWHDMRATLSPALTASRIRNMMSFVSTVGHQTTAALKADILAGGTCIFEFKDFAAKLATDIIASCAFGIEINSFLDTNNEFSKITKQVMNLASFKNGLKFAGFLTIPWLMKALKISIFDKECLDFFQHAIFDTMHTREQLNIERNDLIQLLMLAKTGRLKHESSGEEKKLDSFAAVEESQMGGREIKRKWKDVELAAQCFIFFLAGFDTVAQTMSFLAYELACNPDVQQLLFEEILKMHNTLDGKAISYEQLQSMKYLDAVICETLRKWPALPVNDRVCVKDYELKCDGKIIKFEAQKTSLAIPVWNIHRDPKYYPDPDRFDPMRFSDENKRNIDRNTFMPFGGGPRSCIGSRFALMEIKTILYRLLLDFSIEVTGKTQIPLRLAKVPFNIKPEKGIWVELRPRA